MTIMVRRMAAAGRQTGQHGPGAVAENIHVEITTLRQREKELLGMAWTFETLKPIPSYTPPNPFKAIYQLPKHSYLSLWGSFSLKPPHTASALITLYFFQKENPNGKCFLTESAPEQRWTFLPLPALYHCVQEQATQVLHHPYQGVMANGKDNIPRG